MALIDPIYDEELQTAIQEGLVQNINVMNDASMGTLLMGMGDFFGNFRRETIYDRVSDMVQRRDVDSTAAVTPSSLSLIEDVEVVLDYRTRLQQSLEDFKRRGKSSDEFIRVTSQQFVEELVRRYLNLGVGGLVAAVDANLGMKDVTLNGQQAGVNHILKAEELYGERYGDVKAYMMNASAYHALRRDEVNNFKELDTVAGMLITEGMAATMGKPVIVSNIPALSYDDAGTQRNRILGLTEGALSVVERGDRTTFIDQDGSGENISASISIDGSMRMGLKGYAYNDATAGKSPTDAVFQTASSWAKIYENELTGASLVEALA